MNTHIKTRTCLPLISVFLLALLLGSGPAPTAAQESTRGDFTLYGTGAVLPKGQPGEWDSGFVMSPKVLYHDGLFHMFYIGGRNLAETKAVGYAVSVDGLDWVKHRGNPVLELDPVLAAYGVYAAVPWVDHDQWMLFISPVDRPGLGAGDTILLATATAPTGPWHVDPDPVLHQGNDSEWSARSLEPTSVVATPDGLVIYLTGTNTGRYTIGHVVLSGDKLTPTPVLTLAPEAHWDNGFVTGVSVLHNSAGWEMFYFGEVNRSHPDAPRLGVGYAVSADGVVWTLFEDEPFLSLGAKEFPQNPSVVVVDDTYYLYYTIVPFTIVPFRGFNAEIGVATRRAG